MKSLVLTFSLLMAAVTGVSASWTAMQNPRSFDSIELFVAGNDRLFGGTILGEVYGSQDHGDTWVQVGGELPGDYAPVAALTQVGPWLVLSREFFGEFNHRSHFDGQEWSPWEPLPYQAQPIRSMTAIGETLFAVLTGGAVQRSDDYGLSWTPVPVPGGSGVVDVFAQEGRLFAGTGQIIAGQIYRSDDQGASWVEVGSDLGSSFLCAQAYWQGRLLLSVYHMAGIGSLSSSTDFGDSWTRVTSLPSARNINGLAVSSDGRLAIGLSGEEEDGESLYLSADLSHWEGFTAGLPQAARPVNDLVSHDGRFFKTGGSVTAYRAPHPASTSVGGSPEDAALTLHLHPNPARFGSTLRFELSRDSQVDLGIFDLSGRRVATLRNGRLAAGPHEPSWDARDASGTPLPSGVYLARIQAEGQTTVRKLVLQR